ATISNGRILTTSPDRGNLRDEIRDQLAYTIGNLNGRGAGPDINGVTISIGEVRRRGDDLFEASYAARIFVAWPREISIPRTFEFVLPARGDMRGRQAFFRTYGADEDSGRRCLDWSVNNVTVGIFWY